MPSAPSKLKARSASRTTDGLKDSGFHARMKPLSTPLSLMDTTDREKRRYQRFENQSLTVDIARPGIKGIIRTNPAAECLNFSRTGLQFDCPQELKEGEKLTIDIAVDDIVLRDLSAMVVSSRPADGGNWCCGARFCLENPRMQKDSVYRNLLLIEEKLKNDSEFPYDVA